MSGVLGEGAIMKKESVYTLVESIVLFMVFFVGWLIVGSVVW